MRHMGLKSLLRRSSKRAIPKPIIDAAVRPAVRRILRLAFGKRGYKINIGGRGVFRLSPDFASCTVWYSPPNSVNVIAGPRQHGDSGD